MTFAERIEKVAAPEAVQYAIIGRHGRALFEDEDEDRDERDFPVKVVRNQLLAWSEARPLLDYAYDNGWGTADVHAIYAWTDSYLIMVHEYDGQTHVARHPRVIDAPDIRPSFA